MSYFGCKFVKFFVELPTFDCKICLFSLKITPFYYPKTKFKHTLNRAYKAAQKEKLVLKNFQRSKKNLKTQGTANTQ